VQIPTIAPYSSTTMENVVERVAVDGVAGVRRVEHRLQRLLRRQRHGQGHDVRPRHHHVRRVLVAEDEDLVDHLLLFLLDRALCGRPRDEHAQLGLGEDVALGAGRVDADHAEDRVRRRAERPDERVEQRDERADGR
jgi:hypothetical protein